MRELFKFEIKKTFTQRTYLLALLFMIFILIANEFTPMFLGNFEPKQQMEHKLSGTVVDDTFLQEIKQAEDLKQYGPLEFFLKASTGQTDVTDLTEEKLYQTRKEINERLMRQDKISEEDIRFWEKSDERNIAPFRYDYCGLYTAYLEMASFINFMILIVCGIGISGLFANERSAATDQLIFCTKNGKRKLFSVKVLVGVILSLFTAFVLITTEFILGFILYGTEGANVMLQLIIPQCMLHLNMGETAVLMTLFFIFESLIISFIAMTVSQISMNHMVTMAIMILIMFISMINIPSNTGILYILWNMVPGATVGSWLFSDFHLFSLFGLKLINLIYVPIIWFIIGMLLIIVAKISYHHYEVKAR